MAELLLGQPSVEEMIEIARNTVALLKGTRVQLLMFTSGNFAMTDTEMAAGISAQFKLMALRRAGIHADQTFWKVGQEAAAGSYIAANLENYFIIQRPIPPSFAAIGRQIATRRVDELATPCGDVPTAAEACYRLVKALVPVGSLVAIVGAQGYVGSAVKSLCGSNYAIVEIEKGDDILACREAACVVSAAGEPGLIERRHLRRGCVAIDAGFSTRLDRPWLSHGDFAEDVGEVAGHLTPVPGGVGPFQIAIIIENLLARAGVRARAEIAMAT